MRGQLNRRLTSSAASLLSIAGSPPALAIPIAVLAGIRAGGLWLAAPSLAELLISGCILPSVFTLALFRYGRTHTLDLQERTDRLLPSIVTTACCLFAWGVLSLSAAPVSISNLAIGLGGQMALLALLTTRWKVSYHAASAAALVVVSHSLNSSALTIALLILACAIGWARVYQGRHTTVEVVVGALTTFPLGLLS